MDVCIATRPRVRNKVSVNDFWSGFTGSRDVAKVGLEPEPACELAVEKSNRRVATTGQLLVIGIQAGRQYFH